MFTKDGFKDYSVAYALASGFVLLDDQDGEKQRRRSRFERRKNKARK